MTNIIATLSTYGCFCITDGRRKKHDKKEHKWPSYPLKNWKGKTAFIEPIRN